MFLKNILETTIMWMHPESNHSLVCPLNVLSFYHTLSSRSVEAAHRLSWGRDGNTRQSIVAFTGACPDRPERRGPQTCGHPPFWASGMGLLQQNPTELQYSVHKIMTVSTLFCRFLDLTSPVELIGSTRQ